MATRPAPLRSQDLLEQAEEALVCPPHRATALLGVMGFAAPAPALKALDRLAGTPPLVTPLPAVMLVELAQAGNPDRGLRHLERFVEASGERLSLFARLEADPALARRLARLLCHSGFLTDVLVRNPEHLFWLLEDAGVLAVPRPKHQLRAQLRGDLAVARTPGEKLDHLRRAQRRELLRIGAAQVLGCKDVRRVGRELADLADVVLEIVLEVATAELVERHGRPRTGRGQPARFCVVCLGKHGGQELNFSSDIDLVFVYDEDGQTRGGGLARPLANQEFYGRLGEGLVRALTTATPEGLLYRVDMRLRPEGITGPLVRSLRSYWNYYEGRGEVWERQMLIKARRAAGSLPVWRQFARMLTPFIYPVHFAARPQDEIRRVKERIEARMHQRPAGHNNIKLRRGGIRDIEFVVQCLQLLTGRANPAARAHATLPAVARLQRAGALTSAEARALRQAYLFLRRLENLLQIDEGRPAYAVPEDPAQRRSLALLLGLQNGEQLAALLEGHCTRVRRIWERVFHAQPGPPEEWGWLLEADPGTPAAAAALEARGFADGAAAHRALLRLGGLGVMVSLSRGPFEELLPEVLASLAAVPDPDGGLIRLSQVVEAYGAAATLFGLLHARPSFRRMLITVCGSSRFLSELMQRSPGLLDALVSPEPAGEALRRRAAGGDLEALQAWRSQEMLRIGTDDLLGLCSEEETFAGLTELAEGVVQSALGEARRRVAGRRGGDPQGAFACFAAGKLGGRELDFGSDLDLFFVHEDPADGEEAGAGGVFYLEVAQELVRLLQDGGLYRVDARLRPEGTSAPMAVSLSRYRTYLEERAATWERLALSRARVVAGDRGLAARVQQAIDGFVYEGSVDAALVTEMAEIRRRMEPVPARGRSVPLNVKRGPGGLVDIEFVAQLLVLRHGPQRPSMRLTGTREALAAALREGVVEPRAGRSLQEAYARLRRVEKAMRIASDRAEDRLPEGRELAVLARALGETDAGRFAAEIRALMEQTRQTFSRFFAV
ncbi:MAG: bifunctional [glutamate--ammonia ligase]-adenylyl-L-tyrosine phosphorylase/[glutamate--ammonia-ligase] adenylyltransferase [Candidatus Latescibacterota bacterium]